MICRLCGYWEDGGNKRTQKRGRKKLTKRCGMIDFSARQHGDGMKSPAAEGLGRALEAAGAGHPEKPPEGVAIRRFQGNDYRNRRGFSEGAERCLRGKSPKERPSSERGGLVEARGKKKGRDARRARQSEEAFKRHNLKEELAEAWRK